MTHARQANEEIRAKKRQARASEISANAAKQQADVARDLSSSKKFESIGKGVGGISKGFEAVTKGAAAVGTLLNDPRWYKTFPAYSESVARLPSVLGPGSQLYSPYFGYLAGGLDQVQPTVCAFDWAPSVGPQTSSVARLNPINVAADYVMTQLRKLNSRSGTEYDPSDILQVMISIGSILTLVKEAKYILRAAYTYDGQHARMGDMLMTAKGMLPAQLVVIRGSLADYRDRLNALIVKMNFLPILKDFALYKRWSLLSELTLLDAKSARAQFYTFHNVIYFQYDAANGVAVAQKTPTDFNSLLNYIESCINALNNITSLTVMFSDMRGAFDASAFYEEPFLEMGEKLTLSLSDEIFDQLHNITMPVVRTSLSYSVSMGRGIVEQLDSTELTTWDIRQDSDGYLFQGNSSGREPSIPYDVTASGNVSLASTVADTQIINNRARPLFLDFHKDDVSIDDVLVASRLTSRWTWNMAYSVWELHESGSEVVLDARFVTNTGSSNATVYTLTGHVAYSNPGTTQWAAILMQASQFHCLPRFYSGTNTLFGAQYYGLHYDVVHMVNLSDDDMHNMHTSAFISEITSPFSAIKSVR